MVEKKFYKEKGWTDAILVFWLQAFGIGGAVGLSSILQHIIFWKGVFASAIQWWDKVVRPLAHELFYWAFDLFHLKLTDFWKDWLAIGTIIGLGFLRHFVLLAYKQSRNRPDDAGRLEAWRQITERRQAGDSVTAGDELYQTATSGPLIPPFLPRWTSISPLIYSVISPLLWPVVLLFFIVDTFRAVWPPYDYDTKRFIVYAISTVILPFYWLLAFVAINQYVLK